MTEIEICKRCNKEIEIETYRLLQLSGTDNKFYTLDDFPTTHISFGFRSFHKKCQLLQINKLKIFADFTLGPFADAITRVPALGVAVLGLFAKSIITAVIPSMQKWGFASVVAGAKAERAFKNAERRVRKLTKTTDALVSKTQAADRLQALGGVPFQGKGFQQIRSGQGGKVTAQQLVGMRQAVANSTAVSNSMKRKWDTSLEQMLIATKRATTGMGAQFDLVAGKVQIAAAKMRVHWTNAMVVMKRAVSTLTIAMGKLLSFAGKLSIAFLFFEVARGFFIKDKEIDPFITAVTSATDKMGALTEEFKDFNSVQKIITEDGAGLLTFYTALGQRIGSLSTSFARTGLGFGALQFDKAGITEFQKETDRLRVIINPRGFDTGITGAGTFGEFLLGSKDENLKKTGEFLKSLGSTFSVISTSFGAKGSETINEFIELINAIREAKTSKEARNLSKEYDLQAKKVAALTNVMASLERQRTENKAAVSSILQQFIPESEAIRALISLNKEAADILTVGADAEAFLDEVQNARLQTIKEQVLILIKIDALEKAKVQRDNALKLRGVLEGIGTTKGQQALVAFEQQRLALINRRATAEDRIALIKGSSEKTNEQKRNEIALLNQELELINAQNVALQRKASTTSQLLDATNQALETGLKGGIAALITNNEASLTAALRVLATSMLTAMADTLARQITDKIMGTAPLAVAAAQGAIIANSFLVAGATVAAQIRSAVLGTTVTPVTGGVSPLSKRAGIPTKIGGFINTIKGLFGFATGGIVKADKAGSPAILHGTEAVVPLPDGRSIPVNLGKNAGTNNIEINIYIDSNGQAKSDTTNSAGNLGNALARAVQAELLNQKRSGGILNPFGVA